MSTTIPCSSCGRLVAAVTAPKDDELAYCASCMSGITLALDDIGAYIKGKPAISAEELLKLDQSGKAAYWNLYLGYRKVECAKKKPSQPADSND